MSAGALDDALLDLAVDLAGRAAALAFEGRRRGVPAAGTKSTGTDMVTEFDRACESLIVSGLRTARPDDAIVGEEGTADRGSSGITWFVDPIDGTTNFLYDLPGWAVSIAAADPDGMVIGVVAVPSLGETYTAVRSRGAWRNGEPISVGSVTHLGEALVATGFGYAPERRRRQAALLTTVLPAVRDVRRLGAASVDLCHVACGRVDAYFEEGLGPWDLAAGALVAREAGAVTTDFAGAPARPEEVLATSPALAAALRGLLAEAGAPVRHDPHLP
ncbi:MAG: inositol monophosphatase family protein [Acidimicrobiales bacterium]